MPARGQELVTGIGFKKQAGTGTPTTTKSQVQTGLSTGDMWNLGIDSFSPPIPDFQTETDKDFYGKRNEWVSNGGVFPVSISALWEKSYLLTSQAWAMVCGFIGAVTETSPASGAHMYVGTPLDPIDDGVNLPLTTIAGQVREGDFFDSSLIGCALVGFTLKIQRGPGLQNSSLVLRWQGCGKFAAPSGIAVPDRYTEIRLGAGAATALTVNGVNYITNERFVDLEYTFDNPVSPSGYFPGSGQQEDYDIMGRMRIGKRSQSLTWSAELEEDSPELADLINGVSGPTHITITGPLIAGSSHHMLDILLPNCQHSKYALREVDDFIAVSVTTEIKDSTNGPCIFTAITDKAGIGDE